MKKGISLILSAVIIFSFVGCSVDVTETTSDTSISSETTESVETTITETETSISETTAPSKPYLDSIDPYGISLHQKQYLSDAEYECFKKCIDALMNYETKVKLLSNYDDNLTIYGAFMSSPYYFLVKKVTFSKDHKSINIKYNYSEEEHKEKIEFINSNMLNIINSIITDDMNELDKMLAVNKYFAENIAYDYEWLNEFELSTDKFLFPDATIYEALVDGYGVCHTYSYLNDFVLYQIGVVACTKSGSSNTGGDSGHMWTQVKLGENFYYVDTTWARDEMKDNEGNVYGIANLKYFGMTTEERENTGYKCHEIPTDDIYDNIDVTDTRFSIFRDVEAYELLGNHKVKLYKCSTDKVDTEEIIDTEELLK